MNSISPQLLSNLPECALRFFHGLANWIELTKTSKPQLESWKTAQKLLSKLKTVKIPKDGEMGDIHSVSKNTLYVPSYSSGIFVLRQLRHAFCHNALTYDVAQDQYQIVQTDKVKISGRFSLEAIEEFFQVFLSPKPKQSKIIK
ncbi:MAG: hypothetical protein K2G90_01465 [Muribaculaceae bacterium]|nr:hypothetical protein [Muribaculaceae bacterium]